MKKLRALVVTTVLLVSTDAHALLVDRLVAIVDERPIFLSEVKERATPHVRRIRATTENPVHRSVQEAQAYKEMLERMIDERLEEREAQKLGITVSNEEIEGALEQVAKNVSLTKAELVKEAVRQGMTVDGYRAEIARQILEGKWVQLKVRAHAHVKPGATEKELVEALEKARRKALDELRDRAYVEVML